MRVGRVQDNWILNPTFQQLEYSDMDLVVAGSNDSIMMVEGGALEVSEEDVVEALTVAQNGIRELIGIQEELLDKAGARPKMEWTKAEVDPALKAASREGSPKARSPKRSTRRTSTARIAGRRSA